jgi:uncharacterized protein (TIGR03083 family)
MLDAASIDVVLRQFRPERSALLGLLEALDPEQWSQPTECPLYSIKGVATHTLGDDLSLLSRQRDEADNGLLLLAQEQPGVDFRTLLDTFNDRWVAAAAFLSTDLVIELLQLTGEWITSYYEGVDPRAPGEPVGFFGATGSTSPFWQAIAREFVERWVHHSQIRRALGLKSLSDHDIVDVGVAVAGAAAGVEVVAPDDDSGSWSLGPIDLGSSQQTADILTRAHTADEIRRLASGPSDAVELLAGRRPDLMKHHLQSGSSRHEDPDVPRARRCCISGTALW